MSVKGAGLWKILGDEENLKLDYSLNEKPANVLVVMSSQMGS